MKPDAVFRADSSDSGEVIDNAEVRCPSRADNAEKPICIYLRQPRTQRVLGHAMILIGGDQKCFTVHGVGHFLYTMVGFSRHANLPSAGRVCLSCAPGLMAGGDQSRQGALGSALYENR